MTTPTQDAAALVRRMAIVLETDGWVQKSLHTDEGRCLVGAAVWAGAESDGRTLVQAEVAVQKAIEEQFPNRWRYPHLTMPGFNDHPDTTYEDVKLVLEKAIVYLEEQA